MKRKPLDSKQQSILLDTNKDELLIGSFNNTIKSNIINNKKSPTDSRKFNIFFNKQNYNKIKYRSSIRNNINWIKLIRKIKQKFFVEDLNKINKIISEYNNLSIWNFIFIHLINIKSVLYSFFEFNKNEIGIQTINLNSNKKLEYSNSKIKFRKYNNQFGLLCNEAIRNAIKNTPIPINEWIDYKK